MAMNTILKLKRITAAVLAGAVVCVDFTACNISGSNKSKPVAVDEYGEVDAVSLQGGF